MLQLYLIEYQKKKKKKKTIRCLKTNTVKKESALPLPNIGNINIFGYAANSDRRNPEGDSAISYLPAKKLFLISATNNEIASNVTVFAVTLQEEEE